MPELFLCVFHVNAVIVVFTLAVSLQALLSIFLRCLFNLHRLQIRRLRNKYFIFLSFGFNRQLPSPRRPLEILGDLVAQQQLAALLLRAAARVKLLELLVQCLRAEGQH